MEVHESLLRTNPWILKYVRLDWKKKAGEREFQKEVTCNKSKETWNSLNSLGKLQAIWQFWRITLIAHLVKNLLQCGRPGFDPWVGKIPWRKERLLTPVFWPGEFHGVYSPAAAAAKLHQSCPTLCDPIDGSPLGSPVPGILQARILEWVAISFSNAWKWKVKVKSLSCVWLLTTPWTVAH